MHLLNNKKIIVKLIELKKEQRIMLKNFQE